MVCDIQRKTRRRFPAEEKTRIVLEGLPDEASNSLSEISPRSSTENRACPRAETQHAGVIQWENVPPNSENREPAGNPLSQALSGDSEVERKTLSGQERAGDRDRTGDVQLGKLTFYH